MAQTMTREAALRIGLAARELGLAGPEALVRALAARLGLPFSESRLAELAAGEVEAVVREVAPEAAIEAAALQRALFLLRGIGVEGSELPQAESAGELSASILVACASNGGELLDGHFGSCERFLIFRVSTDAVRLVEARPALDADRAEDRNAARAALIGDCQLLMVLSIGGPAAAKVVRAGVHPLKVARPEMARVALERVREALNHPPPWLAKVMGVRAVSLDPYLDAAATS